MRFLLKNFVQILKKLLKVKLHLYQIYKLNVNDANNCLAKFKSNNFLGLIIFVNLLIGKII